MCYCTVIKLSGRLYRESGGVKSEIVVCNIRGDLHTGRVSDHQVIPVPRDIHVTLQEGRSEHDLYDNLFLFNRLIVKCRVFHQEKQCFI